MQWHDLRRFHADFSALTRAELQRQESAIALDPDLHPSSKESKLTRLRELSAAWKPRYRQIYLHSVADKHGVPHQSPDDSAAALAAHWGEIGRNYEVSEARFMTLEPYIQKVLGDEVWKLSEEKFHEMVKKTKDSAPGLDGVPYSAWRAGGP
eukprot:945855-Pyramimonas_sp.AAC.1